MLFAVYGGEDSAFAQTGFLLCYYSVQMNIGLGVFNLIPFPPLDGSNVLEQIYPKVAYFYARIRPYRTLILVVLLMSGALSYPELRGKLAFPSYVDDRQRVDGN